MRREVAHRFWLIFFVIGLRSAPLPAQNSSAPHDHRGASTYQGHISSPEGDFSFENYVTHVVHLSEEIAQREAYDRELYEFGVTYQMAVAHLRDAIDRVRDVSGFLLKNSAAAASCPTKADKSIDVERLLEATFLLNDAEKKWQEARGHDQRYDSLIKRLRERCDDPSAFEAYQAEKLYIFYLAPPEYEEPGWFHTLLDPVGLIGPSKLMSSRAKFNAKYRPSVEKLQNGRITDEKYRDHARAACRTIRDSKKDLPIKLDSLHAEWKGMLTRPIEKTLALRRGVLASCRKRYEDDVIAYFREKARAKALVDHAEEADEALRTGLVIQSNQRLHLAIARLQRISCDQGRAIAESIRTDIALTDVFQLSNAKSVIPLARKALADFGNRCGGNTSGWVARRERKSDDDDAVGFSANVTAEQLVLSLVMLQGGDHPVQGEPPITPQEVRRANIGFPGCLCATPPGNSSGICGACLPGGGPSAVRGGGDPGGPSGGGFRVDIGDPNGARMPRGSSPAPPVNRPGGPPQPPDNGHMHGDAIVGNHLPSSIPSLEDKIKYGEGTGRGDEVPYVRHKHYLDLRVKESGPTSEWAKAFEQQLQSVVPNYDVAQVKLETQDSERAAESYEKALDSLDFSTLAVRADAVPAEVIPASIIEATKHIGSASESAINRWKNFESLDRITSHGLQLLPGSAALALREADQRQRNEYGLLNHSVLGAPYGAISQNIGKTLLTRGDSKLGSDVRRQLNRALILMSSRNTSEPARAEARGAIGMLLGADLAASEGRLFEAGYLGRQATASLDSAMGFGDPSLWKQGIELVHGMATGLDYSGHMMDVAEDAYKGVIKSSVAFGDGHPDSGQIATTISGKPVGRYFQLGRGYIKSNSLGLTYFGALAAKHQTENTGRITSALGAVVSTGRRVPASQIGSFVSWMASPIAATILEEAAIAFAIPGAGVVIDFALSVGPLITLAQHISDEWTKAAGALAEGKEPAADETDSAASSEAKPKSPNQMQKDVERGKAPKTVERVDKGVDRPGLKEKPHIHFDDGSALNNDGTWKHGGKELTEAEKAWILKSGWKLPK